MQPSKGTMSGESLTAELDIIFPEWKKYKERGFYEGIPLDFLNSAYLVMDGPLDMDLLTVVLAQSEKDLKTLEDMGLGNLFAIIGKFPEADINLAERHPYIKYVRDLFNGASDIFSTSNGLEYTFNDKSITEVPSEGNGFVYRAGNFYTAPGVAILASLINRLRKSINFLDIKGMGITGSDLLIRHVTNVVNVPSFESVDFHDISEKGIYLSEEEYLESIIIQLLHAVSCYQRTFKLQHNLHDLGLFCVYAWSEEYDPIKFPLQEVWNERIALKDADFWSYEVGGTTLYIRPMKVILKVFYWGGGDKFSRIGIVNNTSSNLWSIPEYTPPHSYDPEFDIIRFFLDDSASDSKYIDTMALTKLFKFIDPWNERFGRDKSERPIFADPYLMLQSPEFFGKYMYPEGLNQSSKIVRLGKI